MELSEQRKVKLTKDDLEKSYGRELRKFEVNRLVDRAIRQIDVDNLSLANEEDRAKLRKIISSMRLIGLHHLLAESEQEKLTDLQLSISAKTIIQKQVNDNITDICQKSLPFADQILSDSTLNRNRDKILEIDAKVRDLTRKLAERKSYKCKLLRDCAEIRGGDQSVHYIEDLTNQMVIDCREAQLLRDVIVHDIGQSTSRTSDALQQIQEFVDEKLKN